MPTSIMSQSFIASAKSPKNTVASSFPKFPAWLNKINIPPCCFRALFGGSIASMKKRTDSRAHVHYALAPLLDALAAHPELAVVVSAPESMAPDMFVGGQLGDGALELLERQVEGVVLDILASLLESLEQDVDLAQISFAWWSDFPHSPVMGCCRHP